MTGPLEPFGRGGPSSLWQRAHSDPVFLAAFTENYTGTVDPLDALWWLEHPHADSPSGVVSPAARADELRAAVYQHGAGPHSRAAYIAARDHAQDLHDRAAQALDRTIPHSPTPTSTSTVALQPPSLTSNRRRRVALRWIVPLVTLLVVSAIVLLSARRSSVSLLTKPEATSTAAAVSAVNRPYLSQRIRTAVHAVFAADETQLTTATTDLHTMVDPALEDVSIVVSAHERGTGLLHVPVDGLDDFGTMSRISVLVVCSKASTFTLEVTGTEPSGAYRTRRVAIQRVKDASCSQTPATVTAGLIHGEIPTSVSLAVPNGVPAVISVAESS